MATMTPTEFAATVDSDGRTVRKFLRSITPRDEQPGKGSRWALPAGKRDIAKLQKGFREWTAAQAEEALKRAQAAAEVAASQVEDETPEDDTDEELTIDE